MSECTESFKSAFRQSQWFIEMRGRWGMSDPEIFELARGGRTFYKVQTNDAWRIWRLASIRAARIVMQNVGISEIRDMILHDVGIPGSDRQKFEALFKETREYGLHVEFGHEKEQSIFERDIVTGDYYHPLTALAWKFYTLGAEN